MDPSPNSPVPSEFRTWLIVGASRGIGFEFVKQLLALKHRVIATVRTPVAEDFFYISEDRKRDSLAVLECDVTSEKSVRKLSGEVAEIAWLKRIDVVVVNAGVLEYPTRATES